MEAKRCWSSASSSLAGELVDALLGGFEGGLGAEELELDLGVAGEDGGFDVLVGGVDGREQGVGGGLGNHGRLEDALGDVADGQDLAQARDAFVGEERFALAGRAGDEHDQLAMTGEFCVEPEADGGAVGVGQDLAPSMMSACLRLLSVMACAGRRSALRGRRLVEPSRRMLTPSASATASRLRSSSVGPRPPMTATMSARPSAVRTALTRSRLRSPTMVLKATATPISLSFR
jgi:hypothetical protein